MNIILDNIIFALQRAGGVSVYWYELLRRMERDGRSIQVIEHPQSKSNIFRRTLNIDHTSVIDERRLPLWLSRYLPYPVVNGKKCLYHSSYYRRPHFSGAANIVTVYDFTYERFRFGIPRWVHSIQKKTALKTASGVICISENTKRDLLEFYPEKSENKVKVIYLGASELYRPLESVDRRLLLPILIDEPFVLFIGGRESYKNFHIAIESMASLSGYWFVSVGGGELKPHEAELSEKLIPGRHIHFPVIDNERLNMFYNIAHALLYPSRYEGFGIPIIEAMAAGCPVVAVNVSAVPEACGDAGLLVNEIRSESFSDKIRMLENAEFRSETIRKGFKQAERFSWEACYQETMAFYEKILKEES
jgi:mannosyltransferase